MIRSVLIANRGEIAVRITRTLRRMGIRAIAVFSDADAEAMHVRVADEAHRLGPPPARESYLAIDKVLAAAKAACADAIHPGYGFLSENAAFADAVAGAGLIFIGPPASAIRAMGSKSAAKALMEKAGVPLVPGYHGEDQSPDLLAAEAEKIGYPVLIKASAGGGGKGMKVVGAAAEFGDALGSAQREARNAFGDDKVLVEKYLGRPRHIEVQVFADGHGNAVHLFERDCSIQRRHQKVVEEAPAPGLSAERRAAMGQAAVEAARAVGYVGAGTVEFIAEGDAFYFMEMNTRLQVEHPVTELITGQDLVEWQVRVARGEALPLRQEHLAICGAAIEVRLYAEDPQRGFLPQTGRLDHLVLPGDLPGVRIDAGVEQGDEVSIHYDPMIAKVIAAGADRAEAVARLNGALAASEVAGVATNRAFLAAIVGHEAFARAELDTGFIERHRAGLLPATTPVPDRVIAVATFAMLREDCFAQGAVADAADPFSPWGRAWGWRVNRDAHVDVVLMDGERKLQVRAHLRPDAGGTSSARPQGELPAFRIVVDTPGGPLPVAGVESAPGRLDLQVGDVRLTAGVARHGARLTVFLDGHAYTLDHIDPRDAMGPTSAAAGKLIAPMPGSVIRVAAKEGDKVSKGDPLIVIEAMKMEHTVAAPRDGTVASVRYAAGDLVAEGAELMTLDEAE